jgi:hypothetical protein
MRLGGDNPAPVREGGAALRSCHPSALAGRRARPLGPGFFPDSSRALGVVTDLLTILPLSPESNTLVFGKTARHGWRTDRQLCGLGSVEGAKARRMACSLPMSSPLPAPDERQRTLRLSDGVCSYGAIACSFWLPLVARGFTREPPRFSNLNFTRRGRGHWVSSSLQRVRCTLQGIESSRSGRPYLLSIPIRSRRTMRWTEFQTISSVW